MEEIPARAATRPFDCVCETLAARRARLLEEWLKTRHTRRWPTTLRCKPRPDDAALSIQSLRLRQLLGPS